MDNQEGPDLKRFQKELDTFRNKFIKKKQNVLGKFNGITPFKVLVDIISGIAVGGFLGYILDVYLGTLPFMFFILTIFGMIGGVYNVYKDLGIKKEKLMHNPMEQFEVKRIYPFELFGFDISFTNASMMMAINFCAILLLLIIFARRINIIPGRLQMVGETIYGLIDDMILGTAGQDAKKYMPFIFSLFIFIITCNLLGMLPFSFTVTSHIIVTFIMAIVVFTGVTIIGLMRHGFHYLSLFLPSGTPVVMAPLMIFTELFAYMVRPLSLSVRLAANMTAGHIVMKVIASFVIMAGIAGVLPFALLFALTGFEIFVAVLQAYIFTILSCVYLTDAIKLH